MSRFFNRISAKAGLPPGTVVHVGEDTSGEARITVMDYDSEHVEETTVSRASDCLPYRDTGTVTWINVEGLGNTAVIDEIGKNFGFHPLHIEDIVNTNGRPKIEDTGEYMMVILKMLYLWGDGHTSVSEHVSIFFGSSYVISFQEQAGDVFENIRKMIRNSRGKVRREGPDFLAYLLMDSAVDNYFTVIEDLGELVGET
jgi:magnesium transporter